MDLNIRKGDLTLEKCDALIINFFVGDKNLGGATGAVDKALGGLLGRILKEEHFAGKEGDVCYIRPAKFSAKRIFVVGLGERKDFCEETVRNVAAASYTAADKVGAKHVISILHGAGNGTLTAKAAARAMIEGIRLAAYGFHRYKRKKNKPQIKLF